MLSRLIGSSKSLWTQLHQSYGITPQFMHPLDADLLLDESPKSTKRTKTVCTIGYHLKNLVQRLSILIMLASSLMKD